MNKKEIMRKADGNEGLTVKEILAYQKMVTPKQNVYGKYGTLAKAFLEEHDPSKLWSLAGDLPEYLHNIDKQAADLYETMYIKLSSDGAFKKTGEYLKDLQMETEKKYLIEQEILNGLVYAK